MPAPEATERPIRRAVDWPGWLALAWALGWGGLYVQMVVSERAPWLLSTIRALGRGLGKW